MVDDGDRHGAVDRPARVGLVVNPHRTDLRARFVEAVRDHDVEVVEAEVDAADRLAPAATELVAAGVDVVAAIGGDGTQRTVGAALAETGVALGVVPGGTVNLLARVLGVDEIDTAIDAIVSDGRRSIDLGLADDDPFVLNASTGWDAAVIDHVDDAHKRFGRLGYVAAGVRQWIREAPRPVRVAVDDEAWFDDDAVTVVVLNVGQRGSASIDLAPAAAPDDGRLDVVVLRRRSIPAMVRAARAIMRGTQPSDDDLLRSQASSIRVEWTDPVDAQCDGDAMGSGCVFEYAIRPGAIEVCVPNRRSAGRDDD